MNRIPDALMLPDTSPDGVAMSDRLPKILAVAEPLLGIDREAGERAYVRFQGNRRCFVTKYPHDSICFPLNHALAGEPRYQWIDKGDSIEFGYLISAAVIIWRCLETEHAQ